jgi:hypothetical protein
MMAVADAEPKSPFCPPFSKGECYKVWEVERKNLKSAIRKNSAFRFPSLQKRGQGRFYETVEGLMNFFKVSPFSEGEFSPWTSHPSLEKRGRGDFWAEWGRELCSELLRQDTTMLVEHHG